MLRGAIVGASYFAHHHVEAWRRIEGVEIVGVADRDLARAEAFRGQWQLPRAFGSLEALLDDGIPDFVDIVTRPDSHLSLARRACSRGAHVICQKPVAPTWHESAVMADLVRGTTERLIVHDNWRWQPWYRWARRRIDDGAIGMPWHARVVVRLGDGAGPSPYGKQPYFRDMPRLLVYETLVHYLDTLTFLLGPIAEVSCTTSRRNPVIAGDDTAIIMLRFAAGATAVVDATRVNGPAQAPPAFGVCTVEGERGTLVIRGDGTGSLDTAVMGVPTTTPSDGIGAHALEPPGPHQVDDRFTPDLALGYRGDSVRAAQLHYAWCLTNGQRAETEVSAYLPIVWAVEACYASARTGQAHRVAALPQLHGDAAAPSTGTAAIGITGHASDA